MCLISARTEEQDRDYPAARVVKPPVREVREVREAYYPGERASYIATSPRRSYVSERSVRRGDYVYASSPRTSYVSTTRREAGEPVVIVPAGSVSGGSARGRSKSRVREYY